MVLMIEVKIAGKPSDQFLLARNALYLLPDRTLADVTVGAIWCHECKAVSEGEFCEAPNEIAKELEATIKRGFYPEAGPFILASNPDDWDPLICGMQHRLVWARQRKSPPKCLRCGSTKIAPIEHERPLPNGEPGIVELNYVFASTSIDFTLYLYTAEGELLGEMSRIGRNNDFIDCRCPWDVLEERMPPDLRTKTAAYFRSSDHSF